MRTMHDASLDERDKWNTVTRLIRGPTNLLAAQHSTRIDVRRIDRQDARDDPRELEFLVPDFSEAFYARAAPIPHRLGTPVPVTFVARLSDRLEPARRAAGCGRGPR